MVKFTASQPNGRTLVGIGISAWNVERLKQGKPIHLNFEALNLPWKIDLMIMYGETEQAIADELKEVGAIAPQTIIHKEGKPS